MSLDRLLALLGGGRGPTVSVELRFPSEVTPPAVEAFLGSLSGLRRGSRVALETVAASEAIRHYLSADQASVDTLSAQLRGLMPALRIEPATRTRPLRWQFGVRISWPPQSALRTDAVAETAAGLLASLVPLSREEALLVRVVLEPARPPRAPAREHKDRQDAFRGLFAPATVDAHVGSLLRAKHATPLLHAEMIVAAACANPDRAAHLLARVVTVLRSRRGAHGQLRQRRLNERGLTRALTTTTGKGASLSAAELVAMVGFPIGAPLIPGLSLGSAPLLLPDPRIPEQGRLIALSNWPQSAGRKLGQPLIGSMSHALVAAPTGSGKSALIASWILDDARAGRGASRSTGRAT